MNVGELFVDLSLSGTDKFTKGLEKANNSLNQIKETGLEAAERMQSAFGRFEAQASGIAQFGTTLKTFQEATGLSAITLQKFQKAFMGVNVSADETRESIAGLQTIMTDIQRGRPVSQSVALALRDAKIQAHEMRDIYKVMDRLRDVAQGANVDVGRSLFADLNLSGTFYQGLRRLKGDIRSIAPVVGESAIGASAQIQSKIALMKYNMEGRIAQMLARPETARALDAGYKVINSLLSLVEALFRFADKSGALNTVLDFLDKITMLMVSALGAATRATTTSGSGILGLEWLDEFIKNKFQNKEYLRTTGYIPVPAEASNLRLQKQTNSVTMQQTNHFHGPTDPTTPSRVGDATKKAVVDAKLNLRGKEVK